MIKKERIGASSNQAGELERMMLIVEQMMRSRDNDASVEKAVDRVVELEGQFDGRNVTKFLDTYRREMNQRDVSEARQITSFKRVVANNVQRRVIELQEFEFEKERQHGPSSRGRFLLSSRLKTQRGWLDMR